MDDQRRPHFRWNHHDRTLAYLELLESGSLGPGPGLSAGARLLRQCPLPDHVRRPETHNSLRLELDSQCPACIHSKPVAGDGIRRESWIEPDGHPRHQPTTGWIRMAGI